MSARSLYKDNSSTVSKDICPLIRDRSWTINVKSKVLRLLLLQKAPWTSKTDEEILPSHETDYSMK